MSMRLRNRESLGGKFGMRKLLERFKAENPGRQSDV
jgi:hypothetical protein